METSFSHLRLHNMETISEKKWEQIHNVNNVEIKKVYLGEYIPFYGLNTGRYVS